MLGSSPIGSKLIAGFATSGYSIDSIYRIMQRDFTELSRGVMRNIRFKDPSHALARAALQLAVQNGLHMLWQEVEFARKPMKRNPKVGPQLGRKPGSTIDSSL